MNLVSLVVTAGVLIILSAICSGLNLSLMSLDPSDLARKAKIGDRRAKRVLPLRRNAHLSLASILLANVAVISATSLVLETRLNGLVAGLTSTILIVIFGEIFPQALFVRSSLDVTARLAPVLKVMIIITYPLSKPLQLVLDRMFSPQRSKLHSRQELGLIIAEHIDRPESELDDAEVDIIRGALTLSEKHVGDIITPISHVFWLTLDSVIDARKIDEIKDHSWSRMPVFNRALTKCYGLLLMKDLVDIDFDSKSYSVRELPLRPTELVGEKTALDTIFRHFIAAHTHLVPVTRRREVIGIVTIEDVVEEIIGQEIEDEGRVTKPA